MLEEDFFIDFDEQTAFHGRWDRVEVQEGTDRHVVVEIKRGGKAWDREKVRRALKHHQMRSYLWAYERVTGVRPLGVIRTVMAHGKTAGKRRAAAAAAGPEADELTTEMDRHALSRIEAAIRETSLGIRKERFAPKPLAKSCKGCPFLHVCDEGQAAVAPPPKAKAKAKAKAAPAPAPTAAPAGDTWRADIEARIAQLEQAIARMDSGRARRSNSKKHQK